MFTGLVPYEDRAVRLAPTSESVPAHWRVGRLKNAGRFVYGDALPAESRTPGDVRVMGSNGPIGFHAAANTVGKTIVVGRKGSHGKVHLSNEPVWVMDTAYYIDHRSSRENLDWLAHVLRWLPLDQTTKDSAVPGLDRDDAHGAVIPIPPADEQSAIVKYLGHAHARIDRAIVAKRKLIALLEEQKQAIIHQAVTRGLDPTVPLKDSGIPWLGEIPAHWSLEPARKVLRLRKSVVGEGHHDYTLLSLTLRGVIIRDLEKLEGKFPADFSTYQTVGPGQFVFCLFDVDETPRTVGLSSHEGMITGAYRVFDCPEPAWARFAELYFLAMDHRKAFRPLYSGLRKTIPVGAFVQAKMPFPPEAERDLIIRQVRELTAASDELARKTKTELGLLGEFRTRLTSDVVTGQVDVREIAATLPELTDDMLATGDVDTGDSIEDIAEEFMEGETD